jgi:hypothetical protein
MVAAQQQNSTAEQHSRTSEQNMTIIVDYASKKQLKNSIGDRLRYTETSVCGPEYESNGQFLVTDRWHRWYASVTMECDLIVNVR